MRSGWIDNPLLRERIQRPDAQLVVAMDLVARASDFPLEESPVGDSSGIRSDVKRTPSQWENSDASINIEFPVEGGARLIPDSDSVVVEWADNDGHRVEFFPPPQNFQYQAVVWKSEEKEFDSVGGGEPSYVVEIDAGPLPPNETFTLRWQTSWSISSDDTRIGATWEVLHWRQATSAWEVVGEVTVGHIFFFSGSYGPLAEASDITIPGFEVGDKIGMNLKGTDIFEGFGTLDSWSAQKAIWVPPIYFDNATARVISQSDTDLPQEVDLWFARVWRVEEVRNVNGVTRARVLSIGTAWIPPSGPGAETIIFPFSNTTWIGPHADIVPGSTNDFGAEPGQAILIFEIEPRKTFGGRATNCAWLGTSTEHQDEDGNGNVILSRVWTRHLFGESLYLIFEGAPTTVPIREFSLGARIYNPGEVEFATSVTRPDLGEPDPTRVELVAEGEEPGGSELIFEVRDPASGDYIQYRDGDRVGEDNTGRGGFDLSGLALRSDYDMRVQLIPSATGGVTPYARAIGIRELSILSLAGRPDSIVGDQLARVENARWAVDPGSLRGEIGEIVIRLLRTGEVDYRDPITEFLSTHYPGNIDLEIFIGAPGVPFGLWMLVDVWEMEDWDSGPGADMSLFGMSPTHRTRMILPRFDPELEVRTPLRIDNRTLTFAWTTILRDEILMPVRFLPGAGQSHMLPPPTGPVGREITEDATSDGKEELDSIAWLGGGSMITSQGKVRFVQILPEVGEILVDESPEEGGGIDLEILEEFTYEEVRVHNITPGLRARVPEFSVPWAWNEGESRYQQEVVGINQLALLVYRRSWIDPQERLPDPTGKWIITEEVADEAANREVILKGPGIATALVQFAYAYPHLEVGDAIRFQTDRFVGRTLDGTVLKGMLEIDAVIIEQIGVEGRDFLVWMLEFAEVEAPPPPGPGPSESLFEGFAIFSDVHQSTPPEDSQQHAPLQVACVTLCDEPACGGPGGFLIWYSNNPDDLSLGCLSPNNPIPGMLS